MFQVNILYILLDLFKLLLIAAPLFTCQVVHDELRLHLRSHVLLIEQGFEVLLIPRLESTDKIQTLFNVQVDHFLVNVIADILYNAGPFRYTNRFNDKLLAEFYGIINEPTSERYVLYISRIAQRNHHVVIWHHYALRHFCR